MIKTKVENLKELLKKATINFSISNVQVKFEGGKIKSRMISNDGSGISILDIDNNVVDTNDEIEYNFSDPATNIIPFLNLFDSEEVNTEIYDNRIVLKDGRQKTTLNFCSPTIVNIFGTTAVRDDVEWFHEQEIDENFMESFRKIKKIGTRFQKVYFEVKSNELFIETSDKLNQFSNGLRFSLGELKYNDLVLAFNFKDVVNVMTVIDADFENFSIKLAYKEEQDLGILFIKSADDAEQYCLFSREI